MRVRQTLIGKTVVLGIFTLRLALLVLGAYIPFNSERLASNPRLPSEITTGRAPVFLCLKGTDQCLI